MIEELLSFVEGLPARCRYRDRDILRVLLWATLKDRPMVWACQPQNWPEDLRPACLPDPSTVSRRWHHPELQKTAYALHERSVDHLGAVSGYAGLGAPEAPCFPTDMGQKPAPSCVAPHETQSRLMQFVVKAAAQQRAAARIYDRSTQTAPVDYDFLLRQAFNVERSPLT